MDECPACGTPRDGVPVALDEAAPIEAAEVPIGDGPPCPYCGVPMQAGAIIGDRRRLTWLPFDRLLFLGLFAIEGTTVGKSGILSRPRAEGHRCLRCGTIIVDR